MAVTEAPVPTFGSDAVHGPVTRGLLRRTRAVYAVMVVAGALLVALADSSHLQVLGAGLWYPGGGFVLIGGWWLAAAVAVLVAFLVALVVWFGAGGTIFPPLVWLGSAAGAAFAAPDVISEGGQWSAGGVLAAFVLAGVVSGARRRTAIRRRREERAQFFEEELAQVRAVRAAAPVERAQHELTLDEVQSLRYAIDRSLQPVGQLDGFDRIDQFQTSSLRYQLNFAGWATGMAQRVWMPNFHGYIVEAQRRVIEQYLQPDIWRYWRYENAWGNLSLNPDPARRDNIMLTGYLMNNLVLYAANTGDRRFVEPGGLTFRLDDKRAYPHSMETFKDSLLENFTQQNMCLYPCEPNWIYSSCNLYGMTGLRGYDTVMGTSYADTVLDQFRLRLETEFVEPDGALVPLRSKFTGLSVPFPAPDVALPLLFSAVFPDLAERYWTFGRHDIVVDGPDGIDLVLPKGLIDFGNYRRGAGAHYMCLVQSANELGDYEIADLALQHAARDCDLVTEDGVSYYRGASNLANLTIVLGRMLRNRSWWDAFNNVPADSALTGPALVDARYPDVLVARAVSDGEDLDLVLYPGRGAGVQVLGLERLQPGRRYAVTGASDTEVVADRAGKAQVTVLLDGRTPVTVRPVG